MPKRGLALQTAEADNCGSLHFWQREYWDTYMRDEQQEAKEVRYIEGNPVRARLCAGAADWPFSSARFRDEYYRLVVPAVVGGLDGGEAGNT